MYGIPFLKGPNNQASKLTNVTPHWILAIELKKKKKAYQLRLEVELDIKQHDKVIYYLQPLHSSNPSALLKHLFLNLSFL